MCIRDRVRTDQAVRYTKECSLEPTWIQSSLIPFNSLGKERDNLGLSPFPQQDKVLRNYAFKDCTHTPTEKIKLH